MVRKTKSSKKKKPSPSSAAKKAPPRPPNGEEEEEEENREEAFSMLSLQADVASSSTSSSSSDMGFDSTSNGDDPSSSSTTSSDLFWESDLIPRPLSCGKGFGGGNKHKKVVASLGNVGNVIGKDYVRNSPLGGGGKRKGLFSNKAPSNHEAEQFLCSMLGEDCELSMAVVRDVLCQCGYDVEKALDVLLDLSASSQNQLNDGCAGDYSQNYQDLGCFTECDDSGDDEIAKFQMPDSLSESTFSLSEKEVQQILRASGYDYRDYREVLVGPKRQTSMATTELTLPQTLLESLFSIPKSSEHEPDTMNCKNVVKKMESCGQVLDFSTDSVTQLQQNTEYAKGEDYNLFRRSATQHYDAMKSCYQKAATAYSSGQRSYAAILSDQGKVHNKIARKADEKASQEIFHARNKEIQNTVTIDLHGQHVKPAMKLLKVHLLLFTTYIHSVQVLRVITGCGTHGVGKGILKQTVISLVEKEGFKWSEENRGIVLIKLDGLKNFNFVESEYESD